MRKIIESLVWRTRAARFARPVRTEKALAAAAKGPVVVAGLFRTASGIGESARACSDAFIAAGIPHVCVDLSERFNQVDVAADRPLGAMPNGDGPGTLILHVNAPEVAPALHALRRYGGAPWRTIGYWVFELEDAPAHWAGACRHLSEIWAPSRFCVEAFRKLTDLPVRLTPYYVAPPPSDESETVRATKTALVMADGRSSLQRKNVEAAIRVFCAALGDREDWRLIVKTRNIAQLPGVADRLKASASGNPRVEFIDGSLAPAERWRLIWDCDVLISLHRAEGFGLPVAEALSIGKPVVATGWSGVVDFTPPHFLTPYNLVSVDDDSGPYGAFREARWAEPDEKAAIELLRSIADGRIPAPAPQQLSWRPYVAALQEQRGAAPAARALLGDDNGVS